MSDTLKALMPVFIIYFVWVIVLNVQFYFIIQGMTEMTMSDLGDVVFIFIVSSVIAMSMIYGAERYRPVHWWILSGASFPFILCLIMNAVLWFFNYEIDRSDLVNNFGYCCCAMAISIPFAVYLNLLVRQ